MNLEPLGRDAPMGRVERVIHVWAKLLEGVIAVCLAVMVVLVFGNVVLRYAFNSGIAVSEEISRWLFVWLVFLGALVGIHDRAHLGTDALVARLGPSAKKTCLVASYALMLLVCWMLFRGSLEQTQINWDVTAPSSGASMAWFYASGVVFSVSAAAMLAIDLVRLLAGRVRDADLVIVRENEEAGHLP